LEPESSETSRAADPAFDSAIIGNSRVMLVRPALLHERTGLKFVSLAIPGSQPREHFIVLDYLLKYHSNLRALVIGFDETWCFDPLQRSESFDGWVYQADGVDYFRHLYSLATLKRFEELIGDWPRDWPRADGLMDYVPRYRAAGADTPEIVSRKLVQPRPTLPFTSLADFPAAGGLRQILGRLPAATVVIFAWEPIYITMVPEPGSAAEDALNVCHTAFQEIAAARPRTAIVNWSVDRPENRDPANFLDRVHYRHRVAAAFAEDIAGGLNRLLATAANNVTLQN
jgi:hypothetical protein